MPQKKYTAAQKRAFAKRKQSNKKKNAYKPSVKRAQVKDLMPLAEGRKYMRRNVVGSYLAASPGSNNWKVQVPSAWLYMFRENYLENLTTQATSQGFTGRTLFSRYINNQIKVQFDKIEFLSTPVDLRVCYGWCKVPYLTSLESLGQVHSNVNGVKIGYNPEEMIGKKLDNQFTDLFPRNDPKQFKLMYNKRITVRGTDAGQREITEVDPTDAQKSTTRVMPRLVRKDLEYRITWKPNKKYHMIPVSAGDGNDAGGQPIKPDDGDIVNPINAHNSFWTPSNTLNGDLWMPFFAVRINNPEDFGVNPLYRDANLQNYPLMISQNTHYFLDL